jgi:hypothetical protein
VGASVGVTSVGTGDTVYAIPSFLQRGGVSGGYQTTEAASGPVAQAPGTVGGLAATPRPAGLDVSWTAPATGTAAGYVVRWRRSTEAQFTGSRTLFGSSITAIELRSLLGGESYFVAVSAYDVGGNLGAQASVTASTQPAVALQTPVPSFQGTSLNPPPVANAGPDQVVSPGALVTLDGSGSTDPGGAGTLAFLWQQTDGPAASLSDPATVRPTFVAPSTASSVNLTFQLTVTDDGGFSSTDSVNVAVTTGNRPPVARAGADQAVPEGTLVTLDGSASSDPDAAATIAFSWVQTGGTPVTLQGANTPSASFTAPVVAAVGEDLFFELTVTDNGGLKASDTIRVTVEKNGTATEPPGGTGDSGGGGGGGCFVGALAPPKGVGTALCMLLLAVAAVQIVEIVRRRE